MARLHISHADVLRWWRDGVFPHLLYEEWKKIHKSDPLREARTFLREALAGIVGLFAGLVLVAAWYFTRNQALLYSSLIIFVVASVGGSMGFTALLRPNEFGGHVDHLSRFLETQLKLLHNQAISTVKLFVKARFLDRTDKADIDDPCELELDGLKMDRDFLLVAWGEMLELQTIDWYRERIRKLSR